ncbi:MAG: hypothetical protein KDD55_10180, partial [Bdellovibrionales bacterium]|nr:hypothetical protein [Bdellovibrionales bacterium]
DFADIRIENLLKKKNVGNVKIHALLVALDNAIKESSSQDRVQDQSPNIVDSEQRGFWSQTPASVPQYLQGFLVDFEQSALGIKSTQPLIQLWKALPSLFQPQEFLVLWLVQEHGNEQLVQQQLSLSCDDYDACRNEAQKKLAHYCREHLLPLVTLWSEQLKGPGIQESLLIAPQMCRGSLEERQQLLGRMVLASLGAVHPRYREHIFQKHWTFDAEALSFAIESVLEGCNEKEDIKQKKLEVLLPQFSADELLILFNDEK